MNSFAEFLRVERARHGLKTYVLAREAGVEPTRLSRIAVGRVKPTEAERNPYD